ncbi:MAG: response regulator [Verrucomicrobiota bacterium]
MNPQKQQSPADSAHIDVLFIDDSTNLCRAMELWLNSSGYQAMTAFTAAQAEEIALENLPRVVITDIGLPDASGYEVRQRLQRIDGMEATRFIALSGRRGTGDPRHAIESGFHSFISKPPDFEELADVLRECLPDHPAGR